MHLLFSIANLSLSPIKSFAYKNDSYLFMKTKPSVDMTVTDFLKLSNTNNSKDPVRIKLQKVQRSFISEPLQSAKLPLSCPIHHVIPLLLSTVE